MKKQSWAVWAMGAMLLLGTVGARAADASRGVLVFAAASLANVLTDLDKAFTARTGIRVTSSLAASSMLAKQIEAGAPADVYFSADLQWMSYLQQRALLRPGSRHDVAGNSLVLIAPEALQRLGVWDSVASRLVRAENVRTALAYVARGDAPLGIVYRTDALVETAVRVVGVFPADSHSPIVYPVALTRRSNGAAARYLTFITSPDARPVFRKWGFEPLAGK